MVLMRGGFDESEKVTDPVDDDLTIFHCGPKQKCKDGKEHDYSLWEEDDGMGTAVCSKCGHRAIDDDMWY